MNVLELPYLSDTFLILTAIVLSLIVTFFIAILSKKNFDLGIAFALAVCFYLAILVSPAPRQANRLIIQQWIHLDYNQVSTNALRNTVLLACDKRGYLDGYHLRMAKDSFTNDIDSFFKINSESKKLQGFSFDPDAVEKSMSYTDACDYADKHYQSSQRFFKFQEKEN